MRKDEWSEYSLAGLDMLYAALSQTSVHFPQQDKNIALSNTFM